MGKNPMKQMIAIVVALLIFTGSAAAQDVGIFSNCPIEPGLTAPRNIELEHDGDPGLWLRLDVAKCVIGALQTIPLEQQRYKLMEEQLQLSIEELKLTERQLVTSEAETEIFRTNIERAIKGKREAEEELDAWYRHPVLWVAVGVISTSITVYLVKK